MGNKYIPVKATTEHGKEIWHIDVSKLGLEELLLLKKELAGTMICSDIIVDQIICKNIGISRKVYEESGNIRIAKMKQKKKKRKKMRKGVKYYD